MNWSDIGNLVLSALTIGGAAAGTVYAQNPQAPWQALVTTAGVAALGAMINHLRPTPPSAGGLSRRLFLSRR